MPYLTLWDTAANANREVPMAYVIDYDIPDSGSYTDRDGHTWTISSNGNVDNNVKTTTITYSGDVAVDKIVELAHQLLPSLALCDSFGHWYNDISQSMNPLRNENHDTYPYLSLSYSTSDTPEGNRIVGLATEYGTTFDLGLTAYTPQPSYYGCFLAIEDTSGTTEHYYGFIAIKNWYRSESSITIARSKTINNTNLAELEYDPGAKGFRPTGARTTSTKPGIGGRGSNNKVTPEYFTQHIDQPGEPNENEASAAKSGFIKAYEITEASLQGVGACLWGSTLAGFLSGMLVNPLDFIVSLAVFPYRPHMGTSTNIKFGRWKCSSDLTDPTALGENATGFPLTQQFRTIDFGTINIGENWGSFLDYDYTEIELYLPFIGAVNIDPSECMGGTINVQYTIDYYTGMCVANVKCTRPFIAPNGHNYGTVDAQHSYQGNCAIQIPLSRTDYGAMIGNLINACTQAISNPAQGTLTLIGDAVNGGLRPNVSSKGNIVANSGYCSVLYPYIRITRPITAEPDSYQEVMGYPSYINTKLGECEGKCICKDINLSGIHGATDSELERIKQACREGILV